MKTGEVMAFFEDKHYKKPGYLFEELKEILKKDQQCPESDKNASPQSTV